MYGKSHPKLAEKDYKALGTSICSRLQICPPIHVRKQAATDGTYADLKVYLHALAALIQAKSTAPVFFLVPETFGDFAPPPGPKLSTVIDGMSPPFPQVERFHVPSYSGCVYIFFCSWERSIRIPLQR